MHQPKDKCILKYLDLLMTNKEKKNRIDTIMTHSLVNFNLRYNEDKIG